MPTSAPITPAKRERAFLIALAAVVLLAILAWVRPIDYVALGPGPVTDTLGAPGGKALIQASGFTTYASTGRLELTTVTVTTRLSLVEALQAWIAHDQAVVPRDLIFPKGQTNKQIDTQNQTEMADSRVSAVTAALAKLALLHVKVTGTAAGGPAGGVLKAGDEIVGINGHLTHSAAAVRMRISEVQVGKRVGVRFKRGDRVASVVLRTIASPDDPKRPVIGVSLTETTPPGSNVKIVGLDDVGGPSAGLMFALGIYDRLTPGSLTGGKVIAGTGTIDAAGQVGPIGGITLKMIGAKRAGAAWFLTPADNCAEAVRAIPKGLHLARIANLDEAVSAVEGIAAGRNDLPSC